MLGQIFILYFFFQFNCTALLIFVVNLFLQRWSESMNTSNSKGIHILSSASTKSVSGFKNTKLVFFFLFLHKDFPSCKSLLKILT